jgi:hypothetical protein
MPSGLSLPLAFGMNTRLIGSGRYVSSLSASAGSVSRRSTPYALMSAKSWPSTPKSGLFAAQASGQRYSHLLAAANEQHCDRNVSNEGKQQRRGRHAERYHQYLDCDQPAENTAKSVQARLHDKIIKL